MKKPINAAIVGLGRWGSIFGDFLDRFRCCYRLLSGGKGRRFEFVLLRFSHKMWLDETNALWRWCSGFRPAFLSGKTLLGLELTSSER